LDLVFDKSPELFADKGFRHLSSLLVSS
jgi:hypothetical protein